MAMKFKQPTHGFFAGIPPAQLLLLFFRALGMGIFAPVLSLLLLENGCTIATLSLVMGTFGITVVVLEFPSGVAADTFGRRRTFFMALWFSLVSFLLVGLGSGVPLLAVSMLFRGAGTAFGSGSMEALVLEQAVARRGEEALPAITRANTLLETAGVAVGALLGGAVPLLTGRYDAVAWLAAALVLVQAALCWFFVSEPVIASERPASMLACIRECGGLLRRSRLVAALLLSSVGVGFVLFTVESYWQPSFLALGGGNWALGPLSFCGFLAALLGGVAVSALLERRGRAGWWPGFLLGRLAMGAAMVVFSLQGRPSTFVAGYLTVYLLLGCGNIPNDALLAAAIPNRLRSSILSVSSLVLRGGGLLSSLLCGAVVGRIGIPGVWRIAGLLLAAVMAVCALLGKRAPASVAEPAGE